MAASVAPVDRALRLSLVIAALGGLFLRIWLLVSPAGRLDADEAVVVLMAEGFTNLEPEVFYWGQHYGGSLDAILTAPFFLVTGTSAVMAKLVVVALHALACWFVYLTGRHLCGRDAGAVAGVTAWVVSSAVVWWSTKTRGFYASGAAVSMAVVWLVVRLTTREPGSDADADRRDLLAVGFAAGLAWWISPITLFVLVPAIGAGLVLRRDLWRELWRPIGPFLAGSLPWWIYNVTRGFPSLEQPEAATESTYVERLDGLVTELLPSLLGFRGLFRAGWVGGPVGQVLATVVLVGLLVAAIRLRHRSWIPLVVLVGYPLVAAVASTTEYVEDARYGFLLAPMLALIAATSLSIDRRALIVLPLVAVGFATYGVAELVERAEVPGRPYNLVLSPPDIAPLDDALVDADIGHVYGEYWLAYRVTARSDVEATPMFFVRNDELHAEVVASGSDVWVFYVDSQPAREQRALLDLDGAVYDRLVLDDFEVLIRTG